MDVNVSIPLNLPGFQCGADTEMVVELNITSPDGNKMSVMESLPFSDVMSLMRYMQSLGNNENRPKKVFTS